MFLNGEKKRNCFVLSETKNLFIFVAVFKKTFKLCLLSLSLSLSFLIDLFLFCSCFPPPPFVECVKCDTAECGRSSSILYVNVLRADDEEKEEENNKNNNNTQQPTNNNNNNNKYWNENWIEGPSRVPIFFVFDGICRIQQHKKWWKLMAKSCWLIYILFRIDSVVTLRICVCACQKLLTTWLSFSKFLSWQNGKSRCGCPWPKELSEYEDVSILCGDRQTLLTSSRFPSSLSLVDPVGSVPCVKEEMVLCYRRRKEMASRPFPREYWWNRADTLEFEFLPSADSRGKSFCISCTNSLILLIIVQKIKRMGVWLCVLCCWLQPWRSPFTHESSPRACQSHR